MGNNQIDPLQDGHWFTDILMTFAPDKIDIGSMSPEEMTRVASWKAFAISAAAAIPGGPIGLALILPELAAVTKVQMNLIYRIAEFYGKRPQLNPTIILLIYANQAMISLEKQLLKKVGSRIIIKALSSKSLRPIINKVGAKIGSRVLGRLAGRWIPFVLAPIFGAFSKMMTTQIGIQCIKLFSQDFEVEQEDDSAEEPSVS